jgi:inner membrane protein
MDTLTHGLLGLAVGAVPLPGRRKALVESAPVEARAALLVSVLGAELPDVDYLWPSGDPVLQTLKAHRGFTHALVAVPAVALLAVILTKLFFRRARAGPLYLRALVAVPLAHLLPDLWTGWGTRLFLPFSERRFALDWTMVVDPFFTLPLAMAAVWAFFSRTRWRRTLLVGASVATVYLGFRIATVHALEGRVRAAYDQAVSVRVFPAPLAVLRWRYVAVLADDFYAAGEIVPGRPLEEQARLRSGPETSIPPGLAALPPVREALAWARFPVIRLEPTRPEGQRLQIADLRYHMGGQPTLTFVITASQEGELVDARLDRGGSARALFERWRRGGRK